MKIKERLRDSEDIAKERVRPEGEKIRTQAFSDTCNWYGEEVEKFDKNQQEQIRVEASRSLKATKEKAEELICFAAKVRVTLHYFLVILLPIAVIFIMIDFLTGLSALAWALVASTIICFLSIMLAYGITIHRLYKLYTEVGAFEAVLHLADWRGISDINLGHPFI